MTPRPRLRCPGLSVLLLLSALSLLSAPAQARSEKCEMPKELRFSRIPVGNVGSDAVHYQALFRRLEQATGRPVVFTQASSYAPVVEGLLGGRIDIAELGPATYIEARKNDRSIIPFATIEQRGGIFQPAGAVYHALLVTLANKDYRDMAALKNTRLALTDPGSTSGSLLPRKQLTAQLGSAFENYFSTVSFSGSHAKSVQALLRDEVDSAFISSAQLEEAHADGVLTRKQVRILWTSGPIPYDPFVYRSQLCASLRQQIRAAFFGEGASAALRALLEGKHATRFIATDDKPYQQMRKLLD
jgi:phosphonate transport system substrate-binding protein